VNPNGELERRNLQLGLQTATDAEVASGLNAGDLVVVSDRSALKPGEKVNAKEVPVMEYRGDASE
jgi:hypothetical protein